VQLAPKRLHLPNRSHSRAPQHPIHVCRVEGVLKLMIEPAVVSAPILGEGPSADNGHERQVVAAPRDERNFRETS
jgi:hypothetical protein